MLGLTVLLPLLFVSGMGFMIEMNGIFFSNAKVPEHVRPVNCSWDEQMRILSERNVRGRGSLLMCRGDHPYLTILDAQGTHQISPSGEEVFFSPRQNWTETPAARKHFFVEWHGGEKFGPLGSLYNWISSFSVTTLVLSGGLMWWRKRKRN
jgi:hypothetical protein